PECFMNRHFGRSFHRHRNNYGVEEISVETRPTHAQCGFWVA
ncbi:hypothetical protein RCH09_003974, partial [Actimicrobium sp. GrIS 1.19]|nr:hypothetical protein [Actimicrobium sp. GrIS 1.19]